LACRTIIRIVVLKLTLDEACVPNRFIFNEEGYVMEMGYNEDNFIIEEVRYEEIDIQESTKFKVLCYHSLLNILAIQKSLMTVSLLLQLALPYCEVQFGNIDEDIDVNFDEVSLVTKNFTSEPVLVSLYVWGAEKHINYFLTENDLHLISITRKLSLKFWDEQLSYGEFIKKFTRLETLEIINLPHIDDQEVRNIFNSISHTVKKNFLRRCSLEKIHFELMNKLNSLESIAIIKTFTFRFSYAKLVSEWPELAKNSQN
jgi:hypothetical protein